MSKRLLVTAIRVANIPRAKLASGYCRRPLISPSTASAITRNDSSDHSSTSSHASAICVASLSVMPESSKHSAVAPSAAMVNAVRISALYR
jgi:hypothetical protein